MSDSKASASVKIVDKWRRRSVADEVSICWICGLDLAEPRTLPCLHSFCSECLLVFLQTYETKGRLDRIFRCPQCKSLVPNYIPEKVSPTWLRMFPTKRSIDNMKDAVNLIEEMCKPCSEKWKIVPATKFCVDCQNFMCLQCETDHKAVKDNVRHKVVNYELKELRTTPASNISKFNCPQHKNLRFSSFCESHGQFLCNSCMESGQHLGCRLKNNIIETVRSITKSEAKLHVINHLKHDERNLGKDHVRVIEHIDGIKRQLDELKARHTTLYCNYVMQATVTDHKTVAMDALKGKLEFDKHHRNPEPVIKTMAKVDAILSEFTSVFVNAVDDKAIRHDVHKSINEIQKILNRELHGGRTDVNKHALKALPEEQTINPFTEGKEPQSSHRHKRQITMAMSEEDVLLLSKAMASVGMISYAGMTGTAFRVGTKYVMTAAHIVRDIVDPERTQDCDWNALDDKYIFITFSELMNDGRFWFVPQVPFLNDDLGVAVLEIKDPAGLPPPLSVSAKDAPDSEQTQVMTVGYRLGIAGVQMKFVESGIDVIMKDSERAQEAVKWLGGEERKYRCSMILDGKDHTALNWKYDNFNNKRILTLDICGDYRSLGSPVLVKSGNGLKVIAILTDSVPECFTDIPKQLQDQFPPEHRFESGPRTSFIYDIMATESKVLADDLYLVDERL